MRLAIMQPYFFPYIGYFQLLKAADLFIVYDNVQFTKKGWIHRNRILVDGHDAYISLSLKKGSDYASVIDRSLSDSFILDNLKLLRRIEASYRKAPYFRKVFPLLEESLLFNESNLFNFLLHSLEKTKTLLNIETPIRIASKIPIDHTLKGKDKVLAICKYLKADEYVNPPGGINLYNRVDFYKKGLQLHFLYPGEINYQQMCAHFIPILSIIDVLMFNSKETINIHLMNYSLR
ncbi:MAG: hypothetical protein EHM79_04950 [Geobacter sp.]|nr:MAG: hypothetical protein EHM79_04950 [Geobacter sp.]